AQGGGTNTITLAATASSTTDYYAGKLILLTNGKGGGEVKKITAYNGSNKIATVDSNWTNNPITKTSNPISSPTINLPRNGQTTEYLNKLCDFLPEHLCREE